MKDFIFAILVILPSVLVVEGKPDGEPVSPYSVCQVFNICSDE